MEVMVFLWVGGEGGDEVGYNSEIYKKCSMLQMLYWELFGNFQTGYLSDYPWTAASALNRNKEATHYRSNHRRCSVKKSVLKISQNSQENTSERLLPTINN